MAAVSTSIELTPVPISRREKCAWINLVVTLMVYLPYFGYVGLLLGRGEFRVATVFMPLFGAFTAGIVLSVLAIAVFASRNRREPKDERDIALENRSVRAAYWVLAALGFFLLVIEPPSFARLTVSHDANFGLLLAAQVFLLCFIIAETVRFAVLAMGYRRGF